MSAESEQSMEVDGGHCIPEDSVPDPAHETPDEDQRLDGPNDNVQDHPSSNENTQNPGPLDVPVEIKHCGGVTGEPESLMSIDAIVVLSGSSIADSHSVHISSDSTTEKEITVRSEVDEDDLIKIQSSNANVDVQTKDSASDVVANKPVESGGQIVLYTRQNCEVVVESLSESISPGVVNERTGSLSDKSEKCREASHLSEVADSLVGTDKSGLEKQVHQAAEVGVNRLVEPVDSSRTDVCQPASKMADACTQENSASSGDFLHDILYI